MALDAVVDSLEGVPEQFHELYQQKDDGKYRLDVAGVEFPEDVQGLKSALEKERVAKKEAEKRLSSFADIDLDEYHALRADKDKREEELAAKRGEFDKLLTKKDEQHRKTLSEKDAALEALSAQLDKLIREDEAIRALGRADADVDLLLPHALARTGVVVDDDGKRRAIVLNDDGAPRLNDDGNEMTISELVAEMEKDDRYKAGFGSGLRSGGGSAARSSAGRAKSSPVGPDADLDTKLAYIEKHGLAGYKEALGLQPPR